MTESMLVTAQLAYVYPRLAELADLRGDRAFAAQLRASGARDLRDAARASGPARAGTRAATAATRQIGTGAIFGEPQPWAMLAGAPTPDAGAHARRQHPPLPRRRRRAARGPARIGSAQSPAADDPTSPSAAGGRGGIGGGNNAVYVGGAWFAVNGWLTLGARRRSTASCPNARDATPGTSPRATRSPPTRRAYPDHWDGMISVDDVCYSYYSEPPRALRQRPATDLRRPDHPAADVDAHGRDPLAGRRRRRRDGYTIDPHLPIRALLAAAADVGVAVTATRRAARLDHADRRGRLRMRVATGLRRPVVTVGGRRARSARDGRFVVFGLPARAGRRATWAVRAR